MIPILVGEKGKGKGSSSNQSNFSSSSGAYTTTVSSEISGAVVCVLWVSGESSLRSSAAGSGRRSCCNRCNRYLFTTARIQVRELE